MFHHWHYSISAHGIGTLRDVCKRHTPRCITNLEVLIAHVRITVATIDEHQPRTFGCSLPDLDENVSFRS